MTLPSDAPSDPAPPTALPDSAPLDSAPPIAPPHSVSSVSAPLDAAQPIAAADMAGVAVRPDPWQSLRRFTQARIALGHTGTSLPTQPHLDFQLAHARARDAVHRSLEVDALRSGLAQRGMALLALRSAAADRHIYLQRPDLGRRLAPDSRERLTAWREALGGAAHELAFVLADGLSARAIETNVLPLLDALLPRLSSEGWRVAPPVLVEQGRVAVGDEVGEVLGVPLVAVLIGERPGLSSPDSLGIYLSYAPRVGMTDAQRNCISNVRPEGLSYAIAAHKLHYLMSEARRRKLTGVALKDEADQPARLGQSPVDGFLTGPR